MLYRKTATGFSAVILGVIALLGTGAQAQMDLDATNTAAAPNAVGAFTFSRETLGTLTGRETFHVIKTHSASQTQFSMRATLGYPTAPGVALGNGPAIRVDLDNLEFNSQVNASNIFIGTATGLYDTAAVPRRVVYGGTGSPGAESRCPGDTCMIVELGTGTAGAGASTGGFVSLPAAGLVAADRFELWLWNEGFRVSPEGNGQILVRHFASSVAAISGDEDDGLRKSTGWKTVVNVASSLRTTFRAGVPAIADVAATPRFTNFAPAGTKALGTATITLSTTHHKAFVTAAEAGEANSTGLVTSLDDVRPTTDGGGVVLTSSTGSMGFGTFWLATASTCAAAGAGRVTLDTEGDDAGRSTAALFTGTRHLCVAPRKSGTGAAPNFEIPVATITAEVSFAARPNYRYGGATGRGIVGSIVRNGATVNLSYVTTSDRYNQRIIITNRGTVDAEYELTDFFTEMGTEATAGAAAMGTVPAGMSVVIRSMDAVTFTGSMRRAAATLTVNAPADVVDVATTQVNLNDGSTDTVNYEVVGTSG